MTLNISLYKKMYNKNIYCHYTRRCIMKCLFLLYEKMYNKNIYCHYIRRRIIETNILLYKKMYNKMFVSII